MIDKQVEENSKINFGYDFVKFLSSCYEQKPADIIVDKLKWKCLVRSVFKSKNTLIVGSTGCGKTKFAQSVAKTLNRSDRFFYFNMGSTQDARATLVGNTFFEKETGTIFKPSQFVSAIQTENSVILLDEITRASHDAWNILFPVLDPLQRYIRLDESKNSDIIKVADGVSFIGTANIGNEYTATRVLDKAFLGRFSTVIEMNPLNLEEEYQLLNIIYPNATEEQKKYYKILCQISDRTRKEINSEDSKITNFISTRNVIEMADQINDGFSLEEVCESSIYPIYSKEGGVDSERVFIKMVVQKFIPINVKNPITGNNG